MTLQRQIALLIICGLLIPGFGCTKTSKTVTINFIAWKTENPEAWQEIIGRFEENNPRITINREMAPQQSTQFHDLLTQKLRSHDKSVDIFLMDVVWPPEFAQAGWVLPLDERFPKSKQKEMFDGTIQAATYNEKLYGIPLYTDSGVLYYRKDLLEKYKLNVPETWEEMISHSKKIVAGEKNKKLHGYSGQFKQYEGLVCDMLEFIHSNGGRLMKPTSKDSIQAIEFVRDQIIGQTSPKGVLTYQEQESLDLFKSGGAIFHRNWPYAWRIVNDKNQSAIPGKVGIAPLPTFKKEMNTATLGGWMVGIHSRSRYPDQAWKFVEYVTSSEVQKYFAVKDSRAPTRKALYKDAEVLGTNPHYASMLPVFETATPRPRTPIYAQVSHILQRFLHESIAHKNSNVARLAEKAKKEIEKATARIE